MAACSPRNGGNQCPGASASEPQGEMCAPQPGGGGQCVNAAYSPTGGFSDRYCGWCDYYNAPDCCSASPISSIGAPGRYVTFARAMEAKITAADPKIPKTLCKGVSSGPAACLIESICQADFSASLTRIARTLVLGE
jgi:hypothetical protein